MLVGFKIKEIASESSRKPIIISIGGYHGLWSPSKACFVRLADFPTPLGLLSLSL